MMLITRSLIFTILHILTAMIFSILAVIAWLLPFKSRYKIVSQWAIFNLWLLKIICRIHYEVKGLDNISNNPCIILCKHQSTWETLALQAIFPPQVWVLKRELLWVPFFGWGLASLNPIAINRRTKTKALNQIIRQGKNRLLSGIWVIIFPEGTRTARGIMNKFGMGGVKLAVQTGFPIIPVAHDAGKVWPRKSFIKYPGMIRLVVGAKIESNGKKASDLNKSAFNWMNIEMKILEGKN